jgi:NAD-dependent SIR2 family protein deacetylase
MAPARREARPAATDRRRIEREAARHERAGRIAEALAALSRLAAAGQADGDLLNRCGDLHRRLGAGAEAMRCWRAAAERLREDGFVHKALAVLRKAAREDPACDDVLERIAELHAELGHVVEARRLTLDLAQRELEKGLDERAFALLERLLAADPDPATRETLARLCEQRGRGSVAAGHYLALGNERSAAGDLAGARAVLERARELAPARDDVEAALVDAYVQLGLWAQALPLAAVRVSRSPERVPELQRLARVQAELGQVATARDTYERLLALQPDDEWRARIALLHAREGDPDRALGGLEPVLGRIEARSGLERAIELLAELLRASPDHVPGLLRLAALHNRAGQREAFARCYETLRRIHEQRGETELAQAAARVQAGARTRHRFADGGAAGETTEAPEAAVAAALEAAAERIATASGLVIAAGAGLNLDYGWPDYRDREAFWTAFPEYRERGLALEELARPGRFEQDPETAWAFYAQRLARARARRSHAGLRTLARWRALAPAGGFVVTSCVEGEYAAAGFDPERVVECCGSILWCQCARECGAQPFPTPRIAPERLPRCSGCGGGARPNVLLHGDWAWDMSRLEAQDARFRSWLNGRRGVVVLELGETPRLPVLRAYVRRLAEDAGATLVRICARDASVPEGGIPVPMSPRRAIEAINERLRAR